MLDSQGETGIFKFNKSANLDKPTERLFTEAINKTTTDIPEQELPFDMERCRDRNSIIENHTQWVEQFLGIPVKNRVPQVEKKIKFYDKNTYEKINEREGNKRSCMGHSNFTTGEIKAVWLEDNKPQSLQIFGHELIHSLSKKIFRITGSGRNFSLITHSAGYENSHNGELGYFNEILTEMMNVDALNYCRDRKWGDNLTGSAVGYHEGVILFDMIFQKMAELKKTDIWSIKKGLYKGYLDGDFSALRVFSDSLPKYIIDTMFGKGLFSLTLTDGNAFNLNLLARNAGINEQEYLDKLLKYSSGQEIELCSGVKLCQTAKTANPK